MKRILLFFMVFLGVFNLNAQRDSIFISVEWNGERQLEVQQKIIYHNTKSRDLSQIKLLNWTAAYSHQKTPLAKRKLEDGWTRMHFSQKEDLGQISDLKIRTKDVDFPNIDENNENIYLPIFLAKGERKELYLTYKIALPTAKITGYGKGKEYLALKYFFLVQDSFEDEKQSAKYFLDLEESQNTNSYWDVDFRVPKGYFVQSNLVENQENQKFSGVLNTDLEFYISTNKPAKLPIFLENSVVNVEFAYPIKSSDWASMEFYLPLHLKFIKEKLGWLPNKILLSPKKYWAESFLGNEDIQLFKNRKLTLFSDAEKVDLNYFSMLSQEVLEQAFRANKNKEHWLKNGLKTYLEIQYLKKFYKERSLFGDILDWKILGMKPLRWMNVSKLKLIDRYGAAYLYVMNENIDQAIGTDFDQLKTENQIAISLFKMGALLDFVAEKEGQNKFENFLQNYIEKNQGEEVKGSLFLEKLEERFGDSYAFIKAYVLEKQRVDFNLESVHDLGEENYEIKITKNTPLDIPFQLAVKNQEGQVQPFWLDTEKEKNKNVYQLKLIQPKNLIVNPYFSFPEINYRNNFSQKGWFGFYKKIKFKFLTDLPNPEFNEIYLRPEIKYNIYDDALLGLKLSNRSLISQPFSYAFTPYMSVGEGKLMGTGDISYKIQPTDAFFKRLILGVSGAYFHYNYNLTYRKVSVFSSLHFKEKNPRSMHRKKLNFSYIYIDRDVLEEEKDQNYPYYGLWNLSFDWHKNHPIHEYALTTSYQLMEKFQKFSVEGRYHWEFLPKKEAHFRVFGGWFIKNKVENAVFDYGISRINDYVFDYSLLGQSAVSGIFSQEFILADAGFKSYVGERANQWVMALNTDIPVWKWFHIYGDIGGYKNRNTAGEWAWDSGVRVEVLPSVLNVYFPMQSSLGFEPNIGGYNKRIRFSLSLDFDKIARLIRKNKNHRE